MEIQTQIGITEKGDPSLDISWTEWVLEQNKPAILIIKNFPSLMRKWPLLFESNVIVHLSMDCLNCNLHFPTSLEVLNSLEKSVENSWLNKKDLKNRVVLRIDPIIPFKEEKTHSFSVWYKRNVEQTIQKAYKIGVRRFRFSFLDLYPHVISRIETTSLPFLPEDLLEGYKKESEKGYNFHVASSTRERWLEFLQSIFSQLKDVEIALCGEPLETPKLQEFSHWIKGCISDRDCSILGVSPIYKTVDTPTQRRLCQCLLNKKEIITKNFSCTYNCFYCYWKGQNF